MKLKLENVGKIRSANIDLNGITVIAGENNTGKSTIGKMLFCVFHAFYKIEEQIREERYIIYCTKSCKSRICYSKVQQYSKSS